MEKFTRLQKKEIADQVHNYLDHLQRYIYPHLQVAKHFQLREIGYGVRINDDYHYFDYPYSEGIDELNGMLREPGSQIHDLDTRIFEEFSAQQAKHEQVPIGYLYYQYKVEEGVFITNAFTNLSLNEPDLLAYLPVMHYSVEMVGDFLAPVHKVENPGRPCKYLLYLNKTLRNITGENSYSRDHVITCTFIANEASDKIETVCHELYSVVFPALETFYNSPILVQLLKEQRRSNVLSYQHSIGNILPGIIGLIDRATDFYENSPEEKRLLMTMSHHINAQNLMLYSLFHLEEVVNTKTRYGVGHPLKNKSIREIFFYYHALANYLGIETKIEIDHSYNKAAFTPQEEFLPDIHLVLWNIWENACKRSRKLGKAFIIVYLSLTEKQEIKISVRNYGSFNKEYLHFMRDPDAPNPNNQHQGLAIIKNIAMKNNWMYLIEQIPVEDSIYSQFTIFIHYGAHN